MATKRLIEFNTSMKVSTVTPANVYVTSDTPNTIVGTVEELSAWNGTKHSFVWTCVDNGELATSTDLNPSRQFAMHFSENILDVLNDKSKIDNHIFGSQEQGV